MEHTFSHLDAQGNVTMVDVGDKAPSKRVAIAEAVVELAPATLELLKKSALPKGDVLACAKIGGIMAAKRTSQLIPLCHSLNLTFADVHFEVRDMPPQVRIEAEARTVGSTGVEMEPLWRPRAPRPLFTTCARPCSATSSSAGCACCTRAAAKAANSTLRNCPHDHAAY